MGQEYQTDPALLRAKQDGSYLCQVLGISNPRDREDHAKCPICGDKCLRYGQEDSGVYLWQCMKGCGKGTVIDALTIVAGYGTDKAGMRRAIEEAKSRYGGSERNGAARNGYRYMPDPNRANETTKRNPEVRYGNLRPDPVLDHERAEEFIENAHQHLLERPNIPSFYKRGLSEEIIKKYRVGFIEYYHLKYHRDDKGKGWLIPASWVMPITDGEGKLKAVKLHFERPHPSVKNKDTGEYEECEGKSRWAPFGLEPKPDREKNITSNHAHYCIWPHPNSFDMPGTRDAFSTDINWWINRIPKSGPLAEEWDRVLYDERLNVGLELGRDPNDFTIQEVQYVFERAYDILKPKIHSAVCQAANTEVKTGDEGMEWDDYVFMCPGELKALSVLSAGFAACGVTGGEGWIPPPSILAPLSGSKCCVFFDDDPPKKLINKRTNGETVIQPGRSWADSMAKALESVGALGLTLKSAGRKEKEN